MKIVLIWTKKKYQKMLDIFQPVPESQLKIWAKNIGYGRTTKDILQWVRTNKKRHDLYERKING